MTDREQLRELLVGAVVLAVDPPDKGVDECMCRLTVKRGPETTRFHLHATDLGWWMSRVQKETQEGPLWMDSEAMLWDLVDHVLLQLPFWEQDKTPLIALDDVKRKALGFRCRETSKEWWCSLSAAKGGRFSLQTPEDRDELARLIGLEARLPKVA